MMRPEEMFALALRVIGVLVLVYGTDYLLSALLFKLGYFNYPESSPGYYLIAGLSYVFAGAYLIRGARGLVRFAYPEEEAGDDDEENKEGDAGG